MRINPKNIQSNYRVNGFTLIELLVVIGIISLLISILMPALGRAKNMAKQVRTSAHARQLMMAYTQYYNDHNDRLMLAYPPSLVDGKTISAKDPDSGHEFEGLTTQRYPWRIVPYVDDVWDLLYTHRSPPERPSELDSQVDANDKAYILSLHPTFGLNAVFLGGHQNSWYQGYKPKGQVDGKTNYTPNLGKHVEYHASGIKYPNEQIVFTESQQFDSSSDTKEVGLFYVLPPVANGRIWDLDEKGEEIKVVDESRLIGLPKGRFSNKTVTAFFDGHVDTLSAKEMKNMRLWSNQAKSKDWDFANPNQNSSTSE